MKAFELFIKAEKLLASDWQRFIENIAEYDKKLALEIVFDVNIIEFFLYAQKNLSLLTTKLGDFLLMPSDRQLINGDSSYKKRPFRLPFQKNINEFRAMEEIERNRQIQKVVIQFYEILFIRIYRVSLFFGNKRGDQYFSRYFTLTNPLPNFEFDFRKDTKLKKKLPPLFLRIDEAAKLFTPIKQEAFLEVFGFPQFSSSVYFPLKNFELSKHTLTVGQTGVGKSKFIELLVKEIVRFRLTNEYRIIIIDPHAALYPQFLNVSNKINLDFIRTQCDLFPAVSEPKIATELTILLFKTLLKDQFHAKMERVLKYVVYILFLKNRMTLYSLRKFLTELEFRQEILRDSAEEYDYLTHFFETDFVEMQTQFYEVAIMPILVLIDELSFIPAFSKTSSNKLESILSNNFLTCFSLNRIYLGEKATRLIAGLIIQQIFLIAQRRSINKKLILIIDEVSIVENESLISILSEARKFNLSLFLSQQYLTQISPDLLRGILSNIYNYFIFKVSDEDARVLTKNLQMKFPDEILAAEKDKGLSESDLKRDLLVNLNPRECLVRVFSKLKFYPCFKGRIMDV
ncbi:ATP-binding protein [Candidatus Roizmanbacteria bacterium]|nr:ATP-binding protein [Candidatus Roizmanbacteria bacterium]